MGCIFLINQLNFVKMEITKIMTAEEARQLMAKRQLKLSDIMYSIEIACKRGHSSLTYDALVDEIPQDIEEELLRLGYFIKRNDYSASSSFIVLSWKEEPSIDLTKPRFNLQKSN